MRVII